MKQIEKDFTKCLFLTSWAQLDLCSGIYVAFWFHMAQQASRFQMVETSKANNRWIFCFKKLPLFYGLLAKQNFPIENILGSVFLSFLLFSFFPVFLSFF
jgi:hypothetical protein